MLRYPVFIAAQHEDGRLEQYNLMVVADNPKEAMDKGFWQIQPRYAGQEGWRIARVVDELRATEVEEDDSSDG